VADNLQDESSKTISVSVIAPAAYLCDFAGQTPATVHHVAAHRVLRDLAYREFFLGEQQRGAAIIIDNGVSDLAGSLGRLTWCGPPGTDKAVFGRRRARGCWRAGR